MNSHQVKMAMKRMGIQQQEIEGVLEVIIRCKDKDIIIPDAGVSKVNMMGQVTWQIVGQAIEKPKNVVPDISDDDVRTVMEQTGEPEEKVREALKRNKGDLAETILEFKQE